MQEILLYLVAVNIGILLAYFHLRGRSRSRYTLALWGVLLSAGALLSLGWTEGWQAWVPVGLFCLLLLVPIGLMWAVRLAARSHRYRLAALLAWLMELLLLRSGRPMRRYLADVSEARAGREGAVLARLEGELAAAPTREAALGVRRQRVGILAAANRHDEVVAAFLGGGTGALSPLDPTAALLVRSLAELGRWEQAARTMALLEFGPSGQDLGAREWLDSARLVFLAGLGEGELLRSLLPPRGSLAEGQSPDRIERWLALAEGREGPPPLAGVELPAGLAELVRRRARESAAVPRSLDWGPGVAPMTSLLTVANLAFFLVAEASGGSLSNQNLVRLGALYSRELLRAEPWRLVSCMFLHYGMPHLAMNLLALWLFGRLAEQAFRPLRFLAVYFAGGIAGGVTSILLGPPIPRVGASGAILGVIGGAALLLLRRGSSWPRPWRRMMLLGLAITLGGSLAFGLFFSAFDNLAHLGGAVGGMAMALLVGPGRRGLTPAAAGRQAGEKPAAAPAGPGDRHA